MRKVLRSRGVAVLVCLVMAQSLALSRSAAPTLIVTDGDILDLRTSVVAAYLDWLSAESDGQAEKAP